MRYFYATRGSDWREIDEEAYNLALACASAYDGSQRIRGDGWRVMAVDVEAIRRERLDVAIG